MVASAITIEGLLKVHLDLVTALQHALEELDARVGKALASIQQSARLLSTIPDVSDITAHVIVAEIGLDMTRFASDAHLRSWAGFCPRNDESVDKRRSTRVRKGAPWLKTTLVSSAWAAARVKDSYLQAQFHRQRARRGAQAERFPCAARDKHREALKASKGEAFTGPAAASSGSA